MRSPRCGSAPARSEFTPRSGPPVPPLSNIHTTRSILLLFTLPEEVVRARHDAGVSPGAALTQSMSMPSAVSMRAIPDAKSSGRSSITSGGRPFFAPIAVSARRATYEHAADAGRRKRQGQRQVGGRAEPIRWAGWSEKRGWNRARRQWRSGVSRGCAGAERAGVESTRASLAVSKPRPKRRPTKYIFHARSTTEKRRGQQRLRKPGPEMRASASTCACAGQASRGTHFSCRCGRRGSGLDNAIPQRTAMMCECVPPPP